MFLFFEENDVVINMNNIEDFYIQKNNNRIVITLTNSTNSYVYGFSTYEKAKAAFNELILKIKSGNPVVVLRDWRSI